MNELEVKVLDDSLIDKVLDYWYSRTKDELLIMGADIDKLPVRNDFKSRLLHQVLLPLTEKKAYALIWFCDNVAIGHCNVNDIEFGMTAKMHLHIWKSDKRKKGMGTALLKKSVAIFFKDLELQYLLCEPFSKNLAPNKTLSKIGFTKIKDYTINPSSFTFEQVVTQWRLDKDHLLNNKK